MGYVSSEHFVLQSTNLHVNGP